MSNVSSTQERFGCQALVATISTLVTNALLEEDPQAVLGLHQPLARMAEKLLALEAPEASHSAKR